MFSEEAQKKEALRLKDEGNLFLKESSFQKAVDSYTKAIELDPKNAIFYSNRAQANIKLENYGLAIVDSNKALEIDPGFMKAYYRKGISLMATLNYKEAQLNFKIVLKNLPNDKLTLENNKQCTNFLKRQAFEKAIEGSTPSFVIETLDYENILMDKTWNGPDLDISCKKSSVDNNLNLKIEGLDTEYLKYMIKTFKEGGKLPKKHVHAIIAKVYELFKEENSLVEISLSHPNVDQSNSTSFIIPDAEVLTVVGDTHGQFYDLLNLFDKFGFVSAKHVYLFNGDFVDRGSWSCEVALYLYVLKLLYPKSVYINRGNHETNDMNKTYGFADECEYKYSKKIFNAFSESFAALPLATLINENYLCMHGGLFSEDNVGLGDIRSINRLPSSGSTQPPKEGLAMELLWTDPQTSEGRSPSKRGIGIQFGPDVTERFCVANKIRKILRSHEVRMGGVEEEHNGRLITVFSAPNYCDATGNLGGVVNFSVNNDYDSSKDDGEGYKLAEDPNCPWKLDFATFEAVPHPDLKPMAYSKSGFGF